MMSVMSRWSCGMECSMNGRPCSARQLIVCPFDTSGRGAFGSQPRITACHVESDVKDRDRKSHRRQSVNLCADSLGMQVKWSPFTAVKVFHRQRLRFLFPNVLTLLSNNIVQELSRIRNLFQLDHLLYGALLAGITDTAWSCRDRLRLLRS